MESAAIEAAESGLVASVISQHRFDAASLVAEAVSTGRFGRIGSAVATVPWWRSQSYYDGRGWRGTWAADGGGALMNQGVHTVDLLLWFMGRPVQSVPEPGCLPTPTSKWRTPPSQPYCSKTAVLHAMTAAYPGLPARIQIMGSEGSAVIENDRLAYFHAADRGSEVPSMGLRGEQDQSAHELAAFPAHGLTTGDPTTDPSGHIRQYRDIVQAANDGRLPAVTISDAVHAIAAVRAVYVSATLQQPVRFDDVLLANTVG